MHAWVGSGDEKHGKRKRKRHEEGEKKVEREKRQEKRG